MKKDFIAMKKKLCYVALAIIAMTGCTSNDYIGDQEKLEAGISRPISFGFDVPTPTRAAGERTGSDAATDLSSQFYIYAIKNESTDKAGNVGTGNLVFNNYVVKWIDNSYSTTSNTKGWEYVGYTLSAKEQANVTPNGAAVAQTIKYWDYGAADYTFYAFSALPADIESDKVKVAKVQDKKTTDDPAHTVYDNGYTVTLAANANLDKLFFAERVNIGKSNNTDRNQANTYGGNVTFRFHNAATKVRVAMYETVPGYSVKIKKFSVDNDGTNPAFADMTDDVTANFAANLQNCAEGTAGNLTVTYRSAAIGLENHPTVSFSGTKANVLTLGTNLAANTELGTSTTAATYDKAEKAYTSVFPNETNTQNLKLKLSYTLVAPVTGETIEITDKTAEIPAQYLQWKPGYAYTYIFKITDDNLYPITFDAVEILAEDGSAEYITTVTEPSITTFGVVLDNTDKFKNYVTGKDEYQLPGGSDKLDIYATIMDGTSVLTPQLFDAAKANFVKVYAVDYKTGTSEAEKTEHPITELSVANAIEHTGGLITATHINVAENDYFATAPAAVTTVPGEDGRTKDINALKLQGVKAAGKYAVEIVTYTAVTLTSGADLNGYYSVDGNGIYSKETSGTYSSGTYYKQVKAYKVITVVAAP